jgi:hypothetical protein
MIVSHSCLVLERNACEDKTVPQSKFQEPRYVAISPQRIIYLQAMKPKLALTE